MKLNDWIVATLNNPEFTAADFKNIQGLSLDNTLLLSKDNYLKSSFITNNPAFKKEDESFDEKKFNDFYETLSKKFADFLLESSLDNYTYGFWDTARKPSSKVSKPKIGIDLVLNPEHRSTGVIGLGMLGEREFSDMELAQQQKIVDFETGELKSYSANDASLFSNPIRWFKELFSEPLVLATYDKDEESINPITGLMEKHYKGEKKINGAGEYYLETLGDRSVIGKKFLSMGDIITSDTSSINKYDFFDSDGLDKDASGVITKNLAAVAPMAFLGPVGASIYSGAYIVREIAKALPMLYQISTTLLGNTSDSKLLNNIAGWGQKLTGGTSEYAKENTFSFENFGNLISDVALLWGQLKVIAESISRLGNDSKKILSAAEGKAMFEFEKQALNLINLAERGEKLSPEIINNLIQYVGVTSVPELKQLTKSDLWKNTILGLAALKKFLPEAEKAYAKRVRLGLDMSLAYMAIVSNTDVYESALEHGASKKEAATLALASTVGMFSVDKYMGLGEMFFDDPDAVARRTFKKVLREESDNLLNNLGNLANKPEIKKSYFDLFKGGIRSAQNAVKKYHSDIKDRGLTIIGKSLGEGLEEVSEELVTDITKSLYELAADFGYTSVKDIGAWDNAKERYLMSFFGGALGGAMFGGIEAFRHPSSAFDKNSKKELLYLIKEGKTNDILDQLDNLHKKGLLGDKNLSVDTTKEGESRVFLTADENHKSQNDFVYDLMKSSILLMDAIINGNQLNVSDDLLFEKMVLSDPKFMQLSSLLKDKSYITGYYEQYQNLVLNFYNNEKDIQDLEQSITDPEKRRDESYLTKRSELISKRELLKLEIEDFKSGKYSLEYVEKMLFAMNPEISGKFLSMAFDLWLQNNYNKKIESLSESELETYTKEWDAYNKANRKLDFDQAYELYKEISKRINPILLELSDTEDVKSWEKIADLLEKDFPLGKIKFYYNITDEELGDVEGLSEEEILAKRKELAEKYNNENLAKFIQIFADNNSIIDASTYRRLVSSILDRRKDLVLSNISGRLRFPTVNTTFENKLKETLRKLNDDLTNIDDIKEEIHQLSTSQITKDLESKIEITYDELSDEIALTFLDLLNLIDEEFSGKVIEINNVKGDELANIENELLSNYLGTIENNEDLLLDLINAHNLELSSDTAELAQEIKNSYIGNNSKSVSGNGLVNAVLISRGMADNIIQQLSEESNENFDLNLDLVVNDLKTNPMYRALSDIKKNLNFDKNPTVKVIKAIASKLGDSFSDIEDTLLSIYEQYERLDNIDDYLLNDEQIQALEKALLYIDIAEGFVSAASLRDNYFHIMPFYKTINEFKKQHSDLIENDEELPELDVDTANVVLQSLNNYRKEINLWIESSKQNSLNKIKEFKEFDKKFKNIKKEFIRANIDAFGDLGEGLDALDWESPNIIFEAEKLLYANFIKYNKTPKELISIFKKIIPEFESIGDQITSELNGQISELTPYDKFIYLVSIFAEDPVNFYIYYKDFVENGLTTSEGKVLAPLASQEYVIKLGHALLSNPKFVNAMLYELKELLESEYASKYNLSLEEYRKKSNVSNKFIVLLNSTIVTGLGGAGKTDVVARALSSKDNVWYSGPSNTQIEHLLSLNPNARGISKQDLFNEILEVGEYTKVISEIESKKSGEKIIYSTQDNGDVVFLKNIKYKTFDNPPKQLIIDEITLFSSGEIQLLSEWAKINNVNLLFLGDENLNGNQLAGYNIDSRYHLAFRTPRLSISLRLANYWKFLNLKALEKMLNELRLADDEKAAALYKLYITNDFKNYLLHYYLENDTLTGDMIVDNFSDEYLSTLNGSIGYIGEDSDDLYLKLKSSGKTIKALSYLDVLGQEFDYVIINKNWKFDSPDKQGSPEFRLFLYMQDLYTMITRSKKGSIILNNGLTDVILGNKQESYTTDAITLNPQSIEEFTKAKLEELNSLDLTPRELTNDDSKITSEEPLNTTESVEVPQSPVEISLQFNSEENKEETNETEPKYSEPISENPYTCYSNITFTGLNSEERNGQIVWMKNGSLRDLDIFLDEDSQKYYPESLRKSELVSSDDQKEYSLYLKKLLGYLHFGGNFKSLPLMIRNIFNESDLKNVEYYLVSEDLDSNKHTILRILQGLTNLSSFISDSKGNPQVISLLAKIKSSKTGKVYTITVGAVESLEGSKKSKQILKDQLKRQHSDWTEEQILNEVNKIIESYDTNIKNLVEQKIRRINTPFMTKTTGLRPANNKYRLVDISYNGEEHSTYDEATLGFVTSPVYTIVDSDSLKSLGLKSSLLGKPIMYVSSNPNLNPNDLAGLYAVQKTNSSNTPTVRMVVLNSEGVSFESLLRPGYSKKYYETSTSSSKTFKLPFVSLPMGVRMYLGLWNFRANLIKFNQELSEFLKDKDVKEIDEITELDSILYNQARGNSYISEDEFRKWVETNLPKETYNKLKILWDFNDGLKSKNIREFRLGYSSKYGAYPRKINDTDVGIYINRDLSQLYENTLNTLFTNIIDKIIPPISKNDFTTFIDKKSTQEQWKKLEKKWVENVKSGVSLDVVTSEGVVINHLFGASESIKLLPTLLQQLNLRYLERGYTGTSEFDSKVLDGKRTIKLGDEVLDYLSIFKTLGKQIDTDEDWEHNESDYIPGVEPHSTKEGKNYGIIDKRLINLFNLAFHGVPATREFNNLDVKGLIKATDALFPNGFYVDTFISDLHDEKINKQVLTNRTFYSTDVVPSGPIVRFSFEEYAEVSSNINNKEKDTITKILKINQQLGTSFLEYLNEEELSEQIEEFLTINKDNLFNGTVQENILDKIVKYDGSKFITLREELNIPIDSIRQLGFLYEITSNGEIYYLSKGSKRGEYKLQKAVPTINSEERQGSTVTLIAEYLISKLGLDDEDSEIFKKIYIGNNENAILTRNDLKNNRRLSLLLEQLNINPLDIINIINQLEDANNGTCILPII